VPRPSGDSSTPATDPRRDWVLGLQRTAGNRAASGLLSGERAQVQREGWLESIGSSVGDAWDTASKAAGSVWDALTGDDEAPAAAPKKAADRPAKPDHGATYTVTDAKALLRSPPPELDPAAFGGMLVPKGTPVKVLDEKRKGGKLYVEVAIVADPPIGIPGGWTAYSNLALRRGVPEPGEPAEPGGGGGGGRVDAAEEIEKVKAMEVPAYVDQPGDDAKRERAIEIANAATGNRKTDLLDELKEADTTLEDWFKGIQPGATFLGEKITGRKGHSGTGVHDELFEKLKIAEQLLTDSTGMDLAALHEEFGITDIGGLRPIRPATDQARGIGLHSYGLAIDITTSHGKNPLLKEKFEGSKAATTSVIERARDFVGFGSSSEFAVAGKASKGTGSSSWERRITQADRWYDVMRDASRALRIYFEFETKTEVTVDGTVLRLDELATAFGAATKDVRSVAEWQEQIKQDRAKVKSSGLLGADPTKGFLNLDKRLVMALVTSGLSWGATLDRSKDIHHFGLYDGTITKKPVSSTAR
jgi:hypothetical protein